MTIEIHTDKAFQSRSSTVIINGVKYKSFKNLQLRINEAGGDLVIEHDSGYLEAYKSEVNKSE